MSGGTSINNNSFYQSYQRKGQGTVIKKKHIRQFQKDFVDASDFKTAMSVLELGCGNSLFLRFLDMLGVTSFEAVDGDQRVLGEMPESLRARVTIADFDTYFAGDQARRFVRRS